MRILFIFLTFLLVQNIVLAQQPKDYFETLDLELKNFSGNKPKINEIIDRETTKYNKTSEKKYLLSSKFAKTFLRNPNDINLLSENYDIYSLGIKEFPYLSIRVQYRLSFIFSENNMPDKASFYADNAILEAKKQNYVLYLAYLYQRKGNILFDKKDYENARKIYLEALNNYQKVKDTANVSSINTTLGEIYRKQGNHPKAYEYFQKALQIIESKKNYSTYDRYILGGVQRGLGLEYSIMGNFDRADKNFHEALVNYKEDPKNESDFVSIIKELSKLYNDFSKTEKTNELFNYAKSIEPELSDTKNKITVADLLLQYYFKINNKPEAQNYVNKLVDLNRQNEKEWNEENRKITDILNNKIINEIDVQNKNRIENQRKKYFWITVTSLLASAFLIILFISSRNKRNREKIIFEKQKLIDEQNKLIMEHNIKVQNEKIKNLYLNLNLKNQTEKAFLQKLKTMRKSSKNVDEMMKDLYFNMHNLLQIDKKNSEFTEESYLQNKIFIKKLKTEFPKLNDKELQLCVYIKLGLEPKEIAIIESTTNGNIRVKKNTVKSKMGLSANENLDDFLKKI